MGKQLSRCSLVRAARQTMANHPLAVRIGADCLIGSHQHSISVRQPPMHTSEMAQITLLGPFKVICEHHVRPPSLMVPPFCSQQESPATRGNPLAPGNRATCGGREPGPSVRRRGGKVGRSLDDSAASPEAVAARAKTKHWRRKTKGLIVGVACGSEGENLELQCRVGKKWRFEPECCARKEEKRARAN